MTERFQLTNDAEVDTALRDLARAIDWPQTPDLLAGLGSRLAGARQEKPRWPRGLFQPTIARALMLAALLALLVAGAAVGIRYGLDLLDIQYGPVPTLAPPTPGMGSTLGLGTPTTIESVTEGAAFPIVIPTDPGTPDEVYLGGEHLRGQVAFVYAPRGDLPPSELLNGAGLLVTQNQGSIDNGLAQKVVDTGGKVDRVLVGDHSAYWFTGSPHGFWYLSPDGEVIFESGRRVGNTLAWQRGDILYRIEGDIELERALQIAGSMP